MKELFICDYCDREFLKNISPSTIKSKHNFCSHLCKGDWQKENLIGENNPFFNKKHTEKIKEIIRIKNSHPSYKKGIPQPQTAGDRNPAKRPEVRALISKRTKETHWDCSGSKNPLYGMRRFGKDNPAYIHGESCRKYPFTFSKELKSNVFKRDEYVCQRCKKYPCNDLTVHHIDYNKENNLKNNLITLCRRCNCQVNANREYWTKYFQFLMEVI